MTTLSSSQPHQYQYQRLFVMSGYVAVVVWPSGDDACNLLVEWLSWIQALLKWIIEESADADVGDGFAILEVRFLELERHLFWWIGCSREFGLVLILNGKVAAWIC